MRSDTGCAPLIHVVDDDQAMRTSLKWLLESVGHEVHTYDNGRAFLDAFVPGRPGCVLLDIRMPALGGFQVQEALQDADVNLPVLFLTAHGDIPMTVRAMKAGAFDFIEKPFNDQKLLDAVQEALDGGSRSQRQKRANDSAKRRLEALSPRERAVLELLADGKSSKLIAQALNISHKTVEVHRAHIREKVGVSSLAELVQLAIEAR